jgi:hypothetical protein
MVMRLTYPLDSGFRRGGAGAVAPGDYRGCHLTREVMDGGGTAAGRRGDEGLTCRWR